MASLPLQAFTSMPTDSIPQKTVPKIEEEKPEKVIEEMPAYPGGNQALFKFIGQNIKYPKAARELGVEGIVVVQFVIMEDGNLDDIKVKQGIEGGKMCDKEALRVVHLMNNWIPGKVNGEAVRVLFSLPIRFKLDKLVRKKRRKRAN